MLFPLNETSREQFFAGYWRRKPLHVPKAVTHMSWLPSAQRCREVLASLQSVSPSQLRVGESSAFGQNVDVADPSLRGVARELSVELSCPQVWFDMVVTSESSGIGCHFDNSDNFTIQLQGAKKWRLADPSTIDPEIRRRSMIRSHDLADVEIEMPENAVEILVEEGDLLYIPLLWLHEGQSTGPSTSCVVTCNTDTPVALIPYLQWVLSEQDAWAEPVPYQSLFDSAGTADRSLVDAYVDRLFDALRDPMLIEAVKRHWIDDRFRRMAM